MEHITTTMRQTKLFPMLAGTGLNPRCPLTGMPMVGSWWTDNYSGRRFEIHARSDVHVVGRYSDQKGDSYYVVPTVIRLKDFERMFRPANVQPEQSVIEPGIT